MEPEPGKDLASLARGVRIDLVIAVCALLVSSLATAASWWQTRVIQQQLSAQVWPYLSIADDLSQDTMQIRVENDGLGPAVLRSASVSVDGRPKADFVAVMHAILGPNIVAHKRPGEPLGLTLNFTGPGSVLRVGDPVTVFAIKSKTFAPRMMHAFSRVTIRVCYCAIVPGACWFNDSTRSDDPKPLTTCNEIPGDLLHVSSKDTIDALSGKF